jgi:hypothetical protein
MRAPADRVRRRLLIAGSAIALVLAAMLFRPITAALVDTAPANTASAITAPLTSGLVGSHASHGVQDVNALPVLRTQLSGAHPQPTTSDVLASGAWPAAVVAVGALVRGQHQPVQQRWRLSPPARGPPPRR